MNQFWIGYNSHPYNAPLWFMAYEVIGSYVVFLLLMLFSKMTATQKRICYFVAICFLIRYPEILSMILGIVLAELSLQETPVKYKKGKSLFCIVAGMLLGGFPLYLKSDFPIYRFLDLWNKTEKYKIYYALGAFLLLWGIFHLDAGCMKKIFTTKPFQVLGKYSMSIYMVHFPLIMSVALGVSLKLFTSGISYTKSAVAASLVCTCCVMLCSMFFYYLIDMPSDKLSRKFYRWWDCLK